MPSDDLKPKYRLEPYNSRTGYTAGYRIREIRPDTDFDPPMWVDHGLLENGRVFKTREEAREFMVERTAARA